MPGVSDLFLLSLEEYPPETLDDEDPFALRCGDPDPFPDALDFHDSRIFEPPEEMGSDFLRIAMGFGSGSEVQEDREVMLGSGSDWGADEFFLGRRSSVSDSIEFSRARPLDPDGLRIVGFGSDSGSDDGEQIVALGREVSELGGEVFEHDAAVCRDRVSADSGIPLCWDCLHIEQDRRDDPLEELEWEEVDELRADERIEESGGDNGGNQEELVTNIDWEFLLSVGRNHDDAESYIGDDHEDYVYTSEYEVLIGQFPDNDLAIKGTPPAAKSVVKDLPTVFLSEEDVAKNNTLCAVCKDGISPEERATKLPCTHHYHGDCILPWLVIRNTCPVCRYELPTDDVEYESWKARRAGGGGSSGDEEGVVVEESRLRYDFEMLSDL